MKTIYIVAGVLILLFLSSMLIIYANNNPIQPKNIQSHTDNECRADGYKKRIIDECEYLEYENGEKTSPRYSYSITHCGNCKNKIHKIQNPEYVGLLTH